MQPRQVIDLSGAFQVEGARSIWRFRCVNFLIDYVSGLLLVQGAEAVQLQLVSRLLTLVHDLV